MNQGSRVIINPWLLLKNIVANLTQLSESMMDLCWPEVETTQYSLISTPIFDIVSYHIGVHRPATKIEL